jgi:Zn-dependent metalloprotease
MSQNGLRTFALHTYDEGSADAVRALRAERPSSAAFAPAAAGGLANLDPETAARLHLQQALESRALPELTAPEVNRATPEFKSLGTEAQPLTGTTTVKFRQTYNKIPVYGSLVTVELDEHNELLAINTSMGEPTNVDPVARISPMQAIDKVRALAGYGAQPLKTTPRLVYYFDAASDRWRLVYVLEDVPQRNREGQQAAGPVPLLMDYLIDAHTGDLVAELPRTPSAARSVQEEGIDELGNLRKFWCVDQGDTIILEDRTLNIQTHDIRFQDIDSAALPGVYVGKPPAPWHTGGVSAHANAAVVATFLREVLRRNGIDNFGGPLISSINCIVADESPDGQEWRNAAWIGTQMVYGQRRVNGKLRSYAVGLDVVGHEMVHGVTDRTARLQYAAQSGALNESYSDIFGIIISNFEESDLMRWNWEMGEDLQGTGIPLRDLSDPAKYEQPAHMRDYRNLPITRAGDWGGVHINSGIHNKAAYNIMTATDAQGRFLFDSRALAALFYLALTQHLSRTSLFSDSRRAVDLTARTLFRNDPVDVRNAKLQAISRAFDAVGIQ